MLLLFHMLSVCPCNTLGTVFSELVLGLDTSWPLPITSDLSSATLSTSAKALDTSMSQLVSSTLFSSSPAPRRSESNFDALTAIVFQKVNALLDQIKLN